MNQPIYYVNGRFVPATEAALPLNDLSIVRGYGVFDLLRTYNGKPFKLREHVQRLANSANAIGLQLPAAPAEIEHIATVTYAHNDISDATIRILVTGGPSENLMLPQGKSTLVVMVNPLAPYPAAEFTHGSKVITVQIERFMPAVKSLNYIGAIMAVQQAKAAGAVEAVYRTKDGRITEGTRSNLFAIRGSQLMTPKDEVLLGITRAVVMEIAEDDFEVVEAPLAYSDLATVDELFLTSTTKEILPVVQVDDQIIGNGAPGPNTQKLMALFRTYTQT